MAWEFWLASSPIPIFIMTLVSRGTCITLEYSNSFMSWGVISERNLPSSLGMGRGPDGAGGAASCLPFLEDFRADPPFPRPDAFALEL
jgi:hypothetical protein